MKTFPYKLFCAVSLVLALLACGCSRQTNLEISLKERGYADNFEQISVSGSVNSPGIYPIYAEDSVGDLLSAAGGLTSNDGSYSISIIITEDGAAFTPQKININRAEEWLLTALPGIGAEKAKAITDYRLEMGGFKNTFEITYVEGIGMGTYEVIKNLISVTG